MKQSTLVVAVTAGVVVAGAGAAYANMMLLQSTADRDPVGELAPVLPARHNGSLSPRPATRPAPRSAPSTASPPPRNAPSHTTEEPVVATAKAAPHASAPVRPMPSGDDDRGDDHEPDDD